ncbi:beta-lactamase family protein (plasmid) [Deinococcus taeanensis]|uniref:serine hydrolase domain-containing protein n=1 Tax=Deinococcus taeanensis TaxID=2737050 RepID=UPI001CDD3C0B|nr:serine hydrolase [Deinococcus taeanensis]UBV44128.1 beta-lactamase family protein [Deinococcus taeanensis]
MPTFAPLPRSSPEAQGLSSRAVVSWLDALKADALELHSFMLLRAGTVIAEGWWSPYSPKRVHRLHSLSKSFTSTAIGLLAAEGRINMDDPVVSFFLDDLPPVVDGHLAAMRVQDLLTMRTGHTEDVTGALFDAPDQDWVRTFLAQPVPHPPGTHFVYNSAATFILSALIQRLTGETLLEFLQPRLLKPLGVEAAHWISNPQGIHVGAWGLHLATEAVARFGQLYLQKAHWDGKQLLPETWVERATSAQVPPGEDETSDWAQGYGFQFWRCRHDAYRADGAFGQFCIVMPQQRAVLAITANVMNMQRVLDHVWTHLLAEMGGEPLPDDSVAQDVLQALSVSLNLTVADQAGRWEANARDETYIFDPNDEGIRWARFTSTPDSCRLTVADGRGEHGIDFGLTDWHEGRTTLWPGGEEPILARAGEQPDGAIVLAMILVEGGFHWEALVNPSAGTLAFRLAPDDFPGGKTLLARRRENSLA